MVKKVFLILSIFTSFYLYSCKSVSSQTSGRFNFENKTIEKDHFQYVDVYNVYTGERYDRNVNPVAQHYVIAEKINDQSYVITFSNQLNYISDNIAYLIDFKPKNVFFSTLAKMTSKDVFTLYTASQNTSEDEDTIVLYDSTTRSSYTEDEYNTPIGVALHTSGSNCTRAFDGASSPSDSCFIMQELCSGRFSGQCQLKWDQPNRRFGIPYYIKDIILK